MPSYMYVLAALVAIGALFGPQLVSLLRRKTEDFDFDGPRGRIDAIANVEEVRVFAEENGYPESLELARQLQAKLCTEQQVSDA